MKIKFLLALLLLLLPCLHVSGKVSLGSDKLVGVFYYPWYEEGANTLHWNLTVGNPTTIVDKPKEGYYDCKNETVIKQQLDWMKEAGIDFVILSWWGWASEGKPPNWVDDAVKKIFQVSNASAPWIKLAIMVEEFNMTSGQYDFQEIHTHILDEFITKYDNICFKLNGKPLICWWNAPTTTDIEANRAEILKENRTEIRIIGHHYDYVNWTAWNPESNSADNKTLISESDGVTCIEPRYDRHYLAEKTNVCFDPDFSEGLYDLQWQATISQAALGNVNIVLIHSWNEYHERSQIEPCQEDLTSKYSNEFSLLNKTKYYIELLKGRLEVQQAPLSCKNASVKIVVASNSTLSNLTCYESGRSLSFNVSGESFSNGFCLMRMPTEAIQTLFNHSYRILFDGIPYSFTELSDTNNTYLLANYTHTTHSIEIIPELSIHTVLPLAMLTMILVAVHKRKHQR